MGIRRLAAHYVLRPEGLVRDGVVTVDDEGTILDFHVSGAPDREHGVEFYSGILIPGMVNAHTHLELSHMKGAVPPGCGFTGFAAAMGTSRRNVGKEEQKEAAAYRDKRMWADGTSAVGDISNSTLTFDIKQSGNIHYHTFAEVYGLATISAGVQADMVRGLQEQGQHASLTPHSMYSLNEGLLRESVSDPDGPLSIHFMESPDEEQLYRREGPMWEWYKQRGFTEDFTCRYRSPAERLISTIPRGRKILLVHNTFLKEEDAVRIVEHFGDGLTWVLCPHSNIHITGQLPPYAMLRRAGGRIAFGTDSLASNHDLSLVEEMKCFTGIPLEELLQGATQCGAEALRLDGILGSIETGKKPGLVQLENVDLETFTLTQRSRTFRHL